MSRNSVILLVKDFDSRWAVARAFATNEGADLARAADPAWKHAEGFATFIDRLGHDAPLPPVGTRLHVLIGGKAMHGYATAWVSLGPVEPVGDFADWRPLDPCGLEG